MELGRLSRAEAEELLGAAFDAPVRDELYRQSGGNTFYLKELARTIQTDSGSATGAVRLPGSVPYAVSAALAGEIEALSVSARDVLKGAAVAGDPFDLYLAAASAAVSTSEALGAVDDLLNADLISATDVPQRFRFRHPLVHRAVYDSAGAGWRMGAHARAAAHLGGAVPIASRAFHVERSAAVGDDEAVNVPVEAAHAAREPSSAARWFEAALRLLPQSEEVMERRLGLMMERTTAPGFRWTAGGMPRLAV